MATGKRETERGARVENEVNFSTHSVQTSNFLSRGADSILNIPGRNYFSNGAVFYPRVHNHFTYNSRFRPRLLSLYNCAPAKERSNRGW